MPAISCGTAPPQRSRQTGRPTRRLALVAADGDMDRREEGAQGVTGRHRLPVDGAMDRAPDGVELVTGRHRPQPDGAQMVSGRHRPQPDGAEMVTGRHHRPEADGAEMVTGRHRLGADWPDEMKWASRVPLSDVLGRELRFPGNAILHCRAVSRHVLLMFPWAGRARLRAGRSPRLESTWAPRPSRCRFPPTP